MSDTSRIIEIQSTDRGQALVLPREFHIPSDRATVRRAGEAVILEPVKGGQWPPGFFESIRIDDPLFARPDQGALPPALRSSAVGL